MTDGIVTFPFERRLEFAPGGQTDVREFVWMTLEGQPPPRAKKIILEARAVGLLDDGDTTAFINAAGLRGA